MRTVLLLLLGLPAIAAATPDPTQPGRHAVGLTTITFTKTSVTTGQPRPLDTWIWYPARAGTGTPEGTYFRDAAVQPGRWPLVLFSHGLCGVPNQSLFLTQALASWGFVVAAPPHPGNEFLDGVPACAEDAADSFANRVADIRFVIDRMLALSASPGTRFTGRINPRRIGMSGHSLGGQTALRVAAVDPRVRATLALAPAVHALVGELSITTPTLIAVGQVDSLAPLVTEAEPYFGMLHGPRFLVELLRTGHYAFSDICAAGILLGNGDCGPGTNTLDQADANRLALRYAVPFLLRYVAGQARFAPLLRPDTAPTGVVLLDAHPRR
jgi:predicted dienelactone hydrolase